MTNLLASLTAMPFFLPALSVLIAVCFVTWPLPIEASKMPVGVSMMMVGIVYAVLMIPLVGWQGGWPTGMASSAYRLVLLGGVISLLGTSCMALLIFLTAPAGKYPDYFLICLMAQVVTIFVMKLYGGNPLNGWHAVAFIGAGIVTFASWKAGL